MHPSLESIFQKGVSSMQNENCSLLGPLRGIHFIVLSAPPLASQVKSPYPSQYIATLLEKTTLACWFARQVQMLGWGKLAWFSGLLSRWNSKTRLQHLCNPEARVKLYIIWQQTSHYLRLPLQAELSGGSASESIDAEIRMLQAARKALLMELLLAICSQSLLASDHCMASISSSCLLLHWLHKCGDLFNRMTKQMDTQEDDSHGILSLWTADSQG